MRVYAINPLERLSEEVSRRANEVGDFPVEALVIRPVGSVLLEIWDEWQVGRRYFTLELVRKPTEPEPRLVSEPQPWTLTSVR